jgi:GNAT superfamily N-acetyltransferase
MSRLEKEPDASIRPAGRGEADAIARLLYEAFVEYESLYTAAAFAATAPAAQVLKNRWEEGPVWVALQGGRIVGTVAAVRKGSGLYIRSMGILPAARGQRLGRSLLERAENFARQLGLGRLYLSTTPLLHRAMRLYERFGFVPTDEGPHELEGTPLYTMEKALH